MKTESAKLMGSGWVWLVYNIETKILEFRQTESNDFIGDLDSNLVPLLCLDMWEHTYYFDYENRKNDYQNNIWLIVNWSMAEQRLFINYQGIN